MNYKTTWDVHLEDFRNVMTLINNNKSFRKDHKQYVEYIDLAQKSSWSNDLHKITMKDIDEIVYPFLNRWGGCRLPRLPNVLIDVVTRADDYIKPLRSLSIEDADFLKLSGKSRHPLILIERAFRMISEAKAGMRTLGPTATSKLLHLILPNLFVMWDDSIREYWGCQGNAVGYSNFMLRMNLLVKSLLYEAKGDEKKITMELPLTIARLLDIYNLSQCP